MRKTIILSMAIALSMTLCAGGRQGIGKQNCEKLNAKHNTKYNFNNLEVAPDTDQGF